MTRDQQRAWSAYQRVVGHRDKDKAWREKYGGMAHRLPVLVRQAGLVQALAFVQAKGEEPYLTLLDDLAHTVGMSREDLLGRSRTSALAEYLRLTRELLRTAQWYRRFAQSVLEVEAGAGE